MPIQVRKSFSSGPKQPNIHDLHRAVSIGCFDDVTRILNSSELDLNTKVCGSTVLSLALYKEMNSIVVALLQYRPTAVAHHWVLDVNKLSKDDKNRLEPPLITACRLGNTTAVSLLLDHGADPEALDNFHHSALWMATRQRHHELVQVLIARGASVFTSSRQWSHSPLYFAVKYSSKRTEIAKTLIKNGASVHIDNARESILFCAISQGTIHIAKLLVAAGYNVSRDAQIRENLQSGMLTRNSTLLKWLRFEQSNAPSLATQCRTSIRQSVVTCSHGQRFIDKLAMLPLPRCIISYLALHDEEP